MDAALLLLRLTLAAVFVVSAVAKLVDPAGGRQALRDFGVAPALLAPLALLLPLAELAVALLLLPSPGVRWGALAALVLLLAFSAAIALQLLRGRTPRCHCFGRLSGAPIGWHTVARNAALAAAAGLLLGRGAGVELTSAAGLSLLGVAAGVALLGGAGWLLVALWRQQGRLLLRLEALEAAAGSPPAAEPRLGTPAPAFVARDLRGVQRSLAELLRRGKPLMLLFGDPACALCNDLLPQVGVWQRAHHAAVTLVLVVRGDAAENRAKTAAFGLTTVLLQDGAGIFEAFGVQGTPSAVWVEADGTLGSAVVGGPRAIAELLASRVASRVTGVAPAPAACPPASEAPSPSSPLRFGLEAPAVALEDLDRKPVRLERFRGRDALLLFWNPHCGFCRTLRGELDAWRDAGRDAGRADGAGAGPQLVVVATGSVDANRDLGASFPVLLDPDFAAGRAFGVRGTPSAVRLDAAGRIASDVVVGGAAVLELLRRPPPTVPVAGLDATTSHPNLSHPTLPGGR